MTSILAWALAAALALNAIQFWMGQAVRTRLDQVRGELVVSQAAAKKLVEESKKRDAEAKRAIEEARVKARDHKARADRILGAPPARPGDDCASAQQRADDWWANRWETPK